MHSGLDAGGDGNVYMATCHGGNNQKWYMDGEQFKQLGMEIIGPLDLWCLQ